MTMCDTHGILTVTVKTNDSQNIQTTTKKKLQLKYTYCVVVLIISRLFSTVFFSSSSPLLVCRRYRGRDRRRYTYFFFFLLFTNISAHFSHSLTQTVLNYRKKMFFFLTFSLIHNTVDTRYVCRYYSPTIGLTHFAVLFFLIYFSFFISFLFLRHLCL